MAGLQPNPAYISNFVPRKGHEPVENGVEKRSKYRELKIERRASDDGHCCKLTRNKVRASNRDNHPKDDPEHPDTEPNRSGDPHWSRHVPMTITRAGRNQVGVAAVESSIRCRLKIRSHRLRTGDSRSRSVCQRCGKISIYRVFDLRYRAD